MSFQKPTYEKARQAIAQHDVTALKRLIRRPLDDTRGQRVHWLSELVRLAALEGLGEAVTHLAALNPLAQGKLLARAWAHGFERGHRAMALTLEAHPGLSRDQRFRYACATHSWTAVGHLLEEKVTLDPVGQALQARLLFEALAACHPANQVNAHLARFLPLADQVPEDAVGCVVTMAMRAQDDALLARTLARMNTVTLQNALKGLMDEAVYHDRYDWAHQVHDAAVLGMSEKTWGEEVIPRAFGLERLRVVEDALNDRPVAQRHFLAQGYMTVAKAVELVEAKNWHQDRDGLALRRRLLLRFFHDDQLDAVKDLIRDSLHGPRRDVALTRLAEWAPDAVRQRWLHEEPTTFAYLISQMRQDHGSTVTVEPPNPRRARNRA